MWPGRVNTSCIQPGWVEADIAAGAKSVPGLPEMIAGRTPMARWGQSDDFAGIAVYLASCASDFMNGSAITIDGGYSIKLFSRPASGC